MEDKRFYDVRRWVLGPETYVDMTGVNIRYKLNPDKTTATIPTIVPIVIQTRTWLDKAYFFPIMRDEMNKNNLLIQNPDYD
jgi:starch-binding outer membrane protein, SusD/RagB family